MDHNGKDILVTGATGSQGGAVVRHLRKHGYRVRALCRNPDKPSARALTDLNVHVVKGDLDDRESIERAASGAYGVFSVQNFWDGFPERFLGFDAEVRQGKNVADAAKAAGVRHLVFASAGGAGTGSQVPHMESKWVIEQHLRALSLPATIIRPVFFMDNFDIPTFGFQQPALEGRVELPLAADKKLQMVAVDDIGHFVALAFDRPADFIGASFELASDALTPAEIADTFTRVTGTPTRSVGEPAHIAKIREFSEEFARMYEWFNARGFEAFLPGLRALHPGLTTFERHLRRAGWDRRKDA